MSQRALKERVWKRDGLKCRYCGRQLRMPPRGAISRHDEEATVDHVVPKARGGKTIYRNLLTACRNCNRRKADKDALEFRLAEVTL
jgi:5-methylcytosine-specific restriction endonuclease McrA